MEGQKRLKGCLGFSVRATRWLGFTAADVIWRRPARAARHRRFRCGDNRNLQRQGEFTAPAGWANPKIGIGPSTASLRSTPTASGSLRNRPHQRPTPWRSFAPYGHRSCDGTEQFPHPLIWSTTPACCWASRMSMARSLLRGSGHGVQLPEGPNYANLFPEPPHAGQWCPPCAEGGGGGFRSAIIGMIQATETVKLITGIGTP